MKHGTQECSALRNVSWLFAVVLTILLVGAVALQEYARYDVRTSPLLGSAGMPGFELTGVKFNDSDWLCFEYMSRGHSSTGTTVVVHGFWSLSQFGPERYEVEMPHYRITLRPD